MSIGWSDELDEDEATANVTGWFAVLGLSSAGSIASAEAFGTPTILQQQRIFSTGIPSAEAVGSPTLSYRQSLSPTGIPSQEAFGGSALDPGDIGILPLGIPSAQAVGIPIVSVGVAWIFTAGVPSGEAFGTATIEPGPVDVIPVGIPSAESFGVAGVGHNITMSGVVSEEAFGQPQINLNVKSTQGIPSAEAFGVPNVVGPPQAIVPVGIASTEAFGGSGLQPGSVNLLPIGIASAETFGTATLSRGPVYLNPSGIPSGEAFGTLAVSRNLNAPGIASQESFGAAMLGVNVVAQGIASAEAFGTTTVDRAVPSVYIVDSRTVNGNNLSTMPTHQAGDYLYMFSYRDGSDTPATTPSATTDVPVWETIGPNGTGNSNALIVRRAKATKSTHTSGIWSNTTFLLCFSVRGAHVFQPVTKTATAVSGTITAPSIDLYNPNGTGLVIHAYGTRRGSSGVAPDAAPSGYTRVNSVHTTVSGLCVNVKDNSTSDGAATQGWNNNNQRWQAVSFEIIDVTYPKPYVSGITTTGSGATTISLPPHAIGDTILLYCSSAGSTLPTVPSAGGAVPTWTSIEADASNGNTAHRLVGCVASSTTYTSGTWTGAGAMHAVVIKGAAASPLGGHTTASGSSAGINCPALTLADASGKSLVLRFHVAINATTWPAPPAGYINLVQQAYGLGGYATAVDLPIDTTAVGTVTRGQGVNHAWSSAAIEILSAA